MTKTPSGLQLLRRLRAFLADCALNSPPGARQALAQTLAALRSGGISPALRTLGLAWRTLPDIGPALLHAHAWLLAAEAHEREAALGLLRRAAALRPTPDIAALTALMLLRQHRMLEARGELERALTTFCVRRGSLLAAVIQIFVQHPAAGAGGWVGCGPDLEPWGEDGIGPGPRLGGGTPPKDFALDGRTGLKGARVQGWVSLGWDPARRPRIALEDEHGVRRTLLPRRAGLRWSFELALRAAGLKGKCIHVVAQLPDGRWQALPDSPLLLPRAVKLPGSAKRLGPWRAARLQKDGSSGTWRGRNGRGDARALPLIDVIVPVYGHREAALACVDAVLATLPDFAHLVIVEDASPDPLLVQALAELAADTRVTLLSNPANRGFAASVNRGLALHPDRDAVLLNSDTRVHGDWLARLRAAAYCAARVGSVTPFSNNGSIASYPRSAGGELAPAEAHAFDALTARVQAGVRVPIPVGVGFCLFLRRECLQAVGLLDEQVFGAGYGEESDLCLRARRQGFVHLLAADVYVHHEGGSSFGSRREALLARSQLLLNLRHPGYDAFVDSFGKADPLAALRRELDEARLAEVCGRCAIVASLALAGGVERYVSERAERLRAQGLQALILRPGLDGPGLDGSGSCRIWVPGMQLPNLEYRLPRELRRLVSLLERLAPVSVELQHFLGHHPRLIEALRRFPCGYEAAIHDYAWICPRVTLVGRGNRYCGEPAAAACADCIRREGAVIEGISVPALRARSRRWLSGAHRITAPSADTVTRIRRYFDVPIELQPHAAVAIPAQPRWSPAAGRRRVALLGGIGVHKGFEVLLRCARDARRRRLPLEFVVVGTTADDARLLKAGNVSITGRYVEHEALHLLQRERPDLIWLPSVWPETWCYALDHALATGVPVVAFDIGALGERLRPLAQGLLLPPALGPAAINDALVEKARSVPSLETKLFE